MDDSIKVKELGAISIAGKITYQLWEHGEHYVKLRNPQHLEQYIYIDKYSLKALAGMFASAANALKVDEREISVPLPEPPL